MPQIRLKHYQTVYILTAEFVLNVIPRDIFLQANDIYRRSGIGMDDAHNYFFVIAIYPRIMIKSVIIIIVPPQSNPDN